MLAGGETSRVETRQTAMLQAQMRDSHGVRSVRVGDISSKGMLVVSDRTPARGEFVDITIGGHELAGQVRWVQGRRIGLRMRERINVAAVQAGRPAQKRIKGKRIEIDNNPDNWSIEKLVLSYGVLGITAFASAYLIVTYFVL